MKYLGGGRDEQLIAIIQVDFFQRFQLVIHERTIFTPWSLHHQRLLLQHQLEVHKNTAASEASAARAVEYRTVELLNRDPPERGVWDDAACTCLCESPNVLLRQWRYNCLKVCGLV